MAANAWLPLITLAQAALAKMQAAGRGPHTLPFESITLPEGLDELQLLAGGRGVGGGGFNNFYSWGINVFGPNVGEKTEGGDQVGLG